MVKTKYVIVSYTRALYMFQRVHKGEFTKPVLGGACYNGLI